MQEVIQHAPIFKEIRQSAAVVTAKCRHLVIKGLKKIYLTEGKI